MAPTIIGLYVRSFSLESLDIEWEFADPAGDLTPYRVRVLRSESPAGPFDYVSAKLQAADLRFVDDTVDQSDRYRQYSYRLELSDEEDPAVPVALSFVATLAFPPSLQTLELMRLHELKLRTDGGVRAIVFKRRTHGLLCPNCWDVDRHRRTLERCTFCFDSAFLGGYMTPIPVWAAWPNHRKLVQRMVTRELHPGERSMDMSGHPVLRPDDLLVVGTNQRFRCEEVTAVERGGFTWRQIVFVREISRADVVYELPVTSAMFKLPPPGTSDIPTPYDNPRIGAA